MRRGARSCTAAAPSQPQQAGRRCCYCCRRGMRDWAGSGRLGEEAGWRCGVHEAASANAQQNTQEHPNPELAPKPTESFTALNCTAFTCHAAHNAAHNRAHWRRAAFVDNDGRRGRRRRRRRRRAGRRRRRRWRGVGYQQRHAAAGKAASPQLAIRAISEAVGRALLAQYAGEAVACLHLQG